MKVTFIDGRGDNHGTAQVPEEWIGMNTPAGCTWVHGYPPSDDSYWDFDQEMWVSPQVRLDDLRAQKIQRINRWRENQKLNDAELQAICRAFGFEAASCHDVAQLLLQQVTSARTKGELEAITWP
jgi:hypothetical protein